MTEKVEIGKATLYCGDCREILPDIGVIDAIISDVPYGISYLSGGGGGQHDRRNGKPIVGDDVPFDPGFLVTRAPNVLLWGADHFYSKLPDYGRFLAWDKIEHNEPWDSFCDIEFAWHSASGAARCFKFLWKGLVRRSDNIADMSRLHPSQKPVALMEWCLEQAGTRKRETICDPFMGVGTTGLACLKMGRRFIGIEIDREYFEIACERIERASAQADLFYSGESENLQGATP